MTGRMGFLLALLTMLATGSPARSAEVLSPIPEAIRTKFKLDPFYQKCVLVGSLPVVGSIKPSDYALKEAAHIIQQMVSQRPEILSALSTNGVKLVVMAHDEYTTDLPEQKDMQPKVYWDARARGLGGKTCSCAEENLLGFPGDPYATENILIHEFAHVIHGEAMRSLDHSFDSRLVKAYRSAMERGRWKGTYAALNPGEYWAESVQNWFDNNRHDDALHNHVHTRAGLKEYDPEAARLCAEVFGDLPWRYQKPEFRPASARAHLAGFDSSSAPRFRWREAPIPPKPQVQFETALGNFVVELDSKAAPLTVSNFLNYVQQRLYNDGSFFRTVTLANQPTNTVKIQVLQGMASQARTNEYYPPIRLERTRDTGLRHVDGTISMARLEPDTAQHHFFICIGDQPALDYGGKRNPDGQGFAAFGRVTKGMDLVSKIHQSPADGQQLSPPISIQRAVRLY
jgi:cyclophilin family peptidyl-prolyl cis-trans isomerase